MSTELRLMSFRRARAPGLMICSFASRISVIMWRVAGSLSDLIDAGIMFCGTPDDVHNQLATFAEGLGGLGNFLMMAQAAELSQQRTGVENAVGKLAEQLKAYETLVRETSRVIDATLGDMEAKTERSRALSQAVQANAQAELDHRGVVLARLGDDVAPPPVLFVGQVEDAAAQGDRSENAEYTYGKRRLREIDRRIRFLTKRLDIAEVADPSQHHGSDQVFFGATVTYETQAGVARTITIKGIDEADALQGEVSWVSPVARALLKSREGDEVQLMTPGGLERLEVIEVRYPAPRVEH